ncbi:S-adenosyl-L-methionine-dependent methyltransferase [Morchella conica CCBAS932]|uniref:Trimethylguanosine synthase n=1 Tax=Morchella conica CCBAS932 TaxID=1392247 RepID=A0A3N4KY58_9PEZI|nr:S-adenosyl-L-methionine-dependent methyltransferase [Morchella conica CCBAS932]
MPQRHKPSEDFLLEDISRTGSETNSSRPHDVPFYTEENPPSGAILSYWRQRQKLFTRYDEGVWMTHDAWYEVTPEKVAEKIAQHIFESGAETVIDAFCGVGGNTIQFALSASCKRVIAIDKNPTAILCAKHNAQIYGVSEKIEFIIGDFFELISTRGSELKSDAVFLSPPWGGPTYRNDEIFDLDTMEPYAGSYIMEQALNVSRNIALYIPRTSNLNQVAKMVPKGERVQAIHYCIQRRSKALTVYFGNLSNLEVSEGI